MPQEKPPTLPKGTPVRHLEEHETDAILERIDGAARLATIGGIEFCGGSSTRRTAKLLQMCYGQFVLALVRFPRAARTIDAVRCRIENLCPPQIAVVFTVQPPMGSGNRFAVKNEKDCSVNHMAAINNCARLPYAYGVECARAPKRILNRCASTLQRVPIPVLPETMTNPLFASGKIVPRHFRKIFCLRLERGAQCSRYAS